jgi:transposase
MGFLTSPLYLLSQFFRGKATEHLIGPGVRPEHLNDSRIGRVLDKLYVYGVTEIFVRIAMSVVEKFDIRLKSGHLDATSLSVSGQYLAPETATSESETAEGTQAPSQTAQGDVCEPQDVVDPEEDMLPIAITYGYSRDHRSDLKQFVMDLIVSGDGDVPLFMQVCDGNQTDKSTFVGFIERFQSQWQQAPPEVFVADAALYSADNLAALGTTPWISRVPASLSAAGFLLQTLEPVQFQPSGLRGYSIVEVCNTYGGIRQRWLVVESQARKEADLKQLQKTLERASSDQSAALATLCAQSFACEADALNAAQAWSKTLKYHTLLNVHIEAKAHYAKAGRPVHGSSPTHYTYHIQATLELNEEVIAKLRRQAGRFILATNLLSQTDWSSDDVLREYKNQQSCERGFRFIKDPLFFASSVFLKSPRRIMALAMIMGLCLMVYSLGQRQLRQALEQAQATVPNQKGKQTAQPTLRWMLQCFQSVHLVWLGGLKHLIRLNDRQRLILPFLGAACQKYYLLY